MDKLFAKALRFAAEKHVGHTRKNGDNYIIHPIRVSQEVFTERQNGKCALCPATGPFDIDHLVYNPLVTVKELRLLCWPCHKKVTWGVRH